MVQLQILSGGKAGKTYSFTHFPVRIGRSSTADLSFEEEGVWDSHMEINFTSDGLMLKTCPNAWVNINDKRTKEAVLHSGDVISIGLLKVRFGLAPMRQRSLTFREGATWTGIGLLCLFEVAVIYWLGR